MLEFLEQVWAVSLTIEHHRKAWLLGVGVHPPLLLGADRGILLHPRNHILAQSLHQSMVDFLVEINEGLPIHRIDPVIHRGAQIQLLPGHIMPRQLRLFPFIDAHMSVHIEHRFDRRPQPHPWFGQFRVPTHGTARFFAQQLQLGAQGSHLRYAIQSQQIPPLARRSKAQPLH